MEYKIINRISGKYVPKWGNQKKFIAVHYLGVDGQNYEIAPDGTGAHFTVYWDGTIYQRCDLNAILWAVGTGGYYTQKHPEARNMNTISIEMCPHCDGNAQDPNDPKWWFTKETQEATVWLVQHLMQELDIPIENVLRHFDIVNKVCPAPYVANNHYKTSWTWDEFKNRVRGYEPKWYRIRKSWENIYSQLGAYENLEKAKTNCPYGYFVFDSEGKKVYEPPKIDSHTNSYFNNMSEKERAEAALEIIKETDKSGILWSVTTAQWILESGYGKTKLATEAENYFGMKCNLSSNSWKSVWDGTSKLTINTQEDPGNGNYYTIQADFRAYPDMEHSILDHAGYLLGAEKSKGVKRYAGLTECKDYKQAIQLIKDGGYATDTRYVAKICDIIQRFNLNRYDDTCEADETQTPETPPESKDPTPVKKWYRVRKAWLDSISQLGAYEHLDNAMVKANENPGYKVFDEQGHVVYDPKPNGGYPYLVRVETDNLRIRKQPSLHADIVGIITPGIYTIVSERSADDYTWGELKSGVGWIALEYVTKLASV